MITIIGQPMKMMHGDGGDKDGGDDGLLGTFSKRALRPGGSVTAFLE